MIIGLSLTALGLAAAWLGFGVRVVQQYERGVVFRFGRVLEAIRGPGLAMIAPGID
ncbi:MAG TPA: slipin family protein, partial [Micromonosporaceae bacterium]